MTRFVDVETPYNGDSEEQIRRNLLYARVCVGDCLRRGEIPYASHIFFTQPGILDDTVPEERKRGIEAGKTLIESLPGIVTVVYTDLGISEGMKLGIDRAIKNKRSIDYRMLGNDWEERANVLARKHAHASIWGF